MDLFSSYWRNAKRPVILVGPFARQSLSREILILLIEKLGCPVLCQPDAKSLVPESHPQFQGTFWGSASKPECLDMMMNADLWVEVGTRWLDYSVLKEPTPPRLDLNLDHLQAPDITLSGPGIMVDLSGWIVDSDLKSHRMESRCSANHVEKPTNGIHAHGSVSQPLSIAGILDVIQSLLQPDDTLIVETGDSWFNGQMIKLPGGVDYHMQLMYGSIGWSLPATLGCQLARPEGRSFLMIGDGSFQMTGQELSTMIRFQTNSVIFIFNNLGYRIETAIHDGPYNYLTNWNYALFAESLCNIFHCNESENKYFMETQNGDQGNQVLIAMRIKTHDDLLLAADRVRKEPKKLTVLECCIHPGDINEALVRFGQAMSPK